MPTTAAYGTWNSPITPESLTEAQVGLGSMVADQRVIYWLESRPEEAGRSVVVRVADDGKAMDDLTPSPFNVRTRVHEYGGGAFVAKDGVLLAANFTDQRLYRLQSGRAPAAVTPDSDTRLRYADATLDPSRGLAFLVREDHRGDGDPVNTIVRLRLDDGEDEGLSLIHI